MTDVLRGANDVTPDDERFIMLRPVGRGDDIPSDLILVQNFFEELRARVPGP